MFYEIFTKLCNEKDISPTATLQNLKISTSKLTAWKNGSLPSASVLILLSEYFQVSIDYLLKGKEKNISENKLTQNENEMLEIFKNFDDREQVKIIGRMEEWLEVKRQREAIIYKQRIVGTQIARRTDRQGIIEPLTAEELERINQLPEETNY